MSVQSRFRRPLVILGVLLALLTGAASIRAAAVWTAASAPLAAKPPSIETLADMLATEQARSAALAVQLDELKAGSADLATALEAARDRIASDQAQAQELSASLDAAKKKLAALEASLRRPATTVAVRAPAAPPPPREDHEDHEDDDGD
jgi:septal ring factor EnvC (AmiA/AmiB activator)